jgi:hypothetical protein
VNDEDFGDGGAFPECWSAQYPLDMGRKKVRAFFRHHVSSPSFGADHSFWVSPVMVAFPTSYRALKAEL